MNPILGAFGFTKNPAIDKTSSLKRRKFARKSYLERALSGADARSCGDKAASEAAIYISPVNPPDYLNSFVFLRTFDKSAVVASFSIFIERVIC
ncbi:hypothetical protein [Burkholderia sp. PAMC 28687]|uniref:hypothetical protein n=1 Tax=Burkholderia sp. PAMC 28687 TaxID=1795874 RepID=UPI0012D7E1DD|nr:hypothetical protein [Burkholderia sp. PAMC 28687]